MSDEVRRIPADELRVFIARLFCAAGAPDDAAAVVADGLVEADLMGLRSHGVMLTDMYVGRLCRGSVTQSEAATVVSERQGAVVLDAGHAFGHVTGRQAMTIAIAKARQFAAGVVTVRHGFHFGAAGRYARQAAEANCIGIVMCNTRPLMPAPGGAERVVGNNPIAIGIPTAGEIPIVLDMATSEAAMGKIRMAEKTGETIPESWAVTAQGNPTTDPAQAIKGMLLPAGGAKGFGLSFMIDLMCGLTSQGAVGPQVQPLYGDYSIPYDCSHLFIAIDVAYFCDPGVFRKQAALAADRIRNGVPAPGVTQLFAPGEPEWRRARAADGVVELDAPVVEMLNRCAEELGIRETPLLPTTREKRHA